MQYGGELYHYGKLGMRWGQHRYQNRYGGLNSAGVRKTQELESEHRRLSNISRLSKKGVERKSSVEKEYQHLTGHDINTKLGPTKPKTVKEMTNEELASYNFRKQLERTYMSFQPTPEPEPVSRGKQFIMGVGTKVILPVITEQAKKFVTKKVSELTMTDADKAEREFEKQYDKAKKHSDLALKKESMRKMKLDNDTRTYEEMLRKAAAGTTSMA